MRYYDNMIRMGRWLDINKKVIAALAVITSMGALYFSRPFTIVDSTLNDIATIVVLIVAFSMKIMACVATNSSVENMVEVKGIYSVMRFPNLVANSLIVCSFALYSGVMWWFWFCTLSTAFFLERIIQYREHRMQKNSPELFQKWSKQTNAITPAILSFKRTTQQFSLKRSLILQLKLATIVSCVMVVLNLLKEYILYFNYSINYTLISIFVLLTVCYVVFRKRA